MKYQNSPSVYEYSSVISMTSAPSSESPDLKVRSQTLPDFKLRIFTRLNACPLPGFTNSFSRIEQGSPSSITFKPDLNSFVEKFAIIGDPFGKEDYDTAGHYQGASADFHAAANSPS